MSDTGSYDLIPARWKKAIDGTRSVRVIVCHDMEAAESTHTAHDVAEYFATTARPASAHLCVDSQHVVRCVHDNDVAYAAPGANHDGLQIELAGYGNQTRDEWLDEFGMSMLALAAQCVADWCQAYNIPAVRLTNDELREGKRGIVGHVQVSEVYQMSDHTDPGPAFPWDAFLSLVQGLLPQDGEHGT